MCKVCHGWCWVVTYKICPLFNGAAQTKIWEQKGQSILSSYSKIKTELIIILASPSSSTSKGTLAFHRSEGIPWVCLQANGIG